MKELYIKLLYLTIYIHTYTHIYIYKHIHSTKHTYIFKKSVTTDMSMPEQKFHGHLNTGHKT